MVIINSNIPLPSDIFGEDEEYSVKTEIVAEVGLKGQRALFLNEHELLKEVGYGRGW